MTAQRGPGHSVAVYCEAGIGRTGTLLAGYLIASGLAPDAAIARVRSLRRGAIETPQQIRFLRSTAAHSHPHGLTTRSSEQRLAFESFLFIMLLLASLCR